MSQRRPSDNRQTSILQAAGFEPEIPAGDPRLRPLGHRDRQTAFTRIKRHEIFTSQTQRRHLEMSYAVTTRCVSTEFVITSAWNVVTNAKDWRKLQIMWLESESKLVSDLYSGGAVFEPRLVHNYPKALQIFLSPSTQILKLHHRWDNGSFRPNPVTSLFTDESDIRCCSVEVFAISLEKKALINKFLCVRIKQEDAFLIFTIVHQEYKHVMRVTKCEQRVTLSWPGTGALPTTRAGRSVAVETFCTPMSETQLHDVRGKWIRQETHARSNKYRCIA